MDYHKEIVAPGDRFSKRARDICTESYNNSPALTMHAGGSGFRAMDGFTYNATVLLEMLDRKICEVGQSDGAGGKPQLFTLLNTPEAFENLCWEIITMNVDDIACRGGLATMILASNIDVKNITEENWHLCEALLNGLGKALKKSHLVLLTGETAVMPYSITAFCDTSDAKQLVLTWSATSLGLAPTPVHAKKTQAQKGMAIVGFTDDGYRCNGGTKLTDIIHGVWGTDMTCLMEDDTARNFIAKAVTPSRSYAHTISRLNGWTLDGRLETSLVQLYGVAHITGGGLLGRLPEILPPGIGAHIDNMPIHNFLRWTQLLSAETENTLTDEECHRTFHGGCGLVLICNQADAETVCKEAKKDGHDARIIGETTASGKGEIVLHSNFLDRDIIHS